MNTFTCKECGKIEIGFTLELLAKGWAIIKKGAEWFQLCVDHKPNDTGKSL